MLKDFKAVAKSCTIMAYIHLCLDEDDTFEGENDDCIEDKRHIETRDIVKYLPIR